MSEVINKTEMNEKLSVIENSNSYEEIRASGALPEPDLTDAYYFVSYSHRDYKRVLKDIIHLKEQGLRIWYDRGLETGKSWRDEALKKLTSFHCKGVIIYISGQFASSSACILELKTALRADKSAVIVDLDGALKTIAFENKKLQTKWGQYRERTAVLAGNIDYADFAQRIGELKSPALFSYKFYDYKKFVAKSVGESVKPWRTFMGLTLFKAVLGPVKSKVALISAVNDKDVESIVLPRRVYDGKKSVRVLGVDAGAFSGCINLRQVTVPDGWTYVARGAFYNCISLKEVVLGTPAKYVLSMKLGELQIPFEHCTSLENIITPKRGRIVFNGTFYGCKQLKSWICPENVSLNGSTFSGCTALEKVSLSKRSYVGSRYQFYNCRSLTKVEVNPASRSRVICNSAFYNCEKLTNIKLHGRVRAIEQSAFENCGLTEIELPEKVNAIHVSAFRGCKDLTFVKLKCRKLKILAEENEAGVDELFPYAETIVAPKGLKIKFKGEFRLTGRKGKFVTYKRAEHDR